MIRYVVIALLLICLAGCTDDEPVAEPPQADGTPAVTPDEPTTPPPPAWEPEEWPGEYEGQGLRLVLEESGEGFTGTVSLKGKTYPLSATGDKFKLEGSFQSKKSFKFTIVQDEHESTIFETGGTRYVLRRD